MEHQIPSIKPIAYKYGMYIAVLNIAGLITVYILNIDKSWTLSIISIILSILIYYFGINEFKSLNTNSLSIGLAIKLGLAIAVIGGVIGGIYAYIHYTYIYPEFIDLQRETSYNQMVIQNPNMSQKQIDGAMSITELFMNSTFFSLSTVLGSLIFGLIVSLILGLVMKRDPK